MKEKERNRSIVDFIIFFSIGVIIATVGIDYIQTKKEVKKMKSAQHVSQSSITNSNKNNLHNYNHNFKNKQKSNKMLKFDKDEFCRSLYKVGDYCQKWGYTQGSGSCSLLKYAMYDNLKHNFYNKFLELFYTYGVHPPEDKIDDWSSGLAYDVSLLCESMCLLGASGSLVSYGEFMRDCKKSIHLDN